MNENITFENLQAFSEQFGADKANRIAMNAVAKNGINESAQGVYAGIKFPHSFSIEIDAGDVCNQRKSGRCWMFASLNVMRLKVMEKLNLKNMELSQSYPLFWDKLEKSTYFLENILNSLDEPTEGRLINWLLQGPVGDGGQWDMLANIVSKYGVVPSYAYPDSKNAAASRWLNEFLTSIIRERAISLRKAALGGASAKELNAQREEALNDVYRILAITLGQPPKTFDLILRDEDDKVTTDENITPKEFFDKYIGIDLSSRISIINATSEDKPMGKTYSVKYLGNVAEGNPVKYLNLPIDTFKEAVIAQLKDGHPVWFGSDCMKFSLREEGIFDRKACGVEQFFNVKYNFTKADRLTYGDSAMNHAMVILGVNIGSDGKPNRWRIENSWGKDAGSKGYYVCSDSWFDEFVYQAVVDKKYLKAKDRKLWEQAPVMLEPWDPMGTLAD